MPSSRCISTTTKRCRRTSRKRSRRNTHNRRAARRLPPHEKEATMAKEKFDRTKPHVNVGT
ncbi:MAG: hypothetical protein F4145_01795, partial [Boseongicola sp. SB0675_bin_26]|nr:hypothetical protein [Boseongicola sp. SB0675_bin_26]